ncbi:DUF7282 domain-containing protein [Haloarcula argentinensis]|uniref:PGF-CTERM sorting domain-containing protein n=1 Tax=Haloarcula argentinensis TaxID=43776 RepID=A0A847U8I9_HALAR|nr:BGTF surface domain-containing protein [Haloarcula argentinensis]NLV12073.1 PGF-CTERM sorting domain-containing protein [Haloarcula argentinensis]
MTGNSNKVRSLFLTALMVFSVFAGTVAFSGGAAAAANVSITQAAEYNEGTVEVALSGPISDGIDADDIDIYVDGNQNPANYVDDEGSDGGPSSGQLVADGDSGRIEIDLNNDVQPNRNLTVKLSNLPDEEGNTDESLVAEDIDVSSQTIQTSGENDTDFSAFRGEVIAIQDEDALGEDGPNIEIGEQGAGIQLADSYTDNSEVYTVETNELDTGEDYTVEVDDNEEAIFTVSDLNLQVNIDDDVGDGADIDDTDTLAVNVSTNRGGQPANATLFNEDDEKEETIIKNLQANRNVVFNFGSQDDDDSPYYVEVTDNQTGVSAQSNQINVSESDDGDASFETSTVQDEIGDAPNITVQVDNTEDAILSVGSTNDDNYAIIAEVNDDDGDGEVTVQFNSYTAGTSSANSNEDYDFSEDGSTSATVLSVYGDDDIEVLEEEGSFNRLDDVDDDDAEEVTLTTDTLEPGSYSINVTAGTNQENIDSPDSVGTLRLNENSVESVQSWAAPSDADIDDEDIDIYDRIGVNLTQSDNIAIEDLAVHQIKASGIEGALEYEQEDGDASGVTSAFSDAVDTDGDTSNGVGDAGLTLYVNRSDVGANADPDPVDFEESEGALTVVEDADNNTYFVALDTGDVTFESGDQLTDEEDTRINATFSVKEGALSEDDTSATSIYQTSERDATLNLDDDEFVTVSAAAGQEVTGTTNVAPGSELEVEMESENEANPFVERPEATVGPNGTYVATEDFSDYSAGTNFTVQTLDVDGDEDFSDEEDGRIVEADTATVSISDQESDGSEVVVDSAQLSEGGFIAIHEGSASDDVVGNSEYLGAGSHDDITITLDEPMDEDFTAVAMPHLDTNGNEEYDFPGDDGPYTQNGSAVTDSANVTIVEEQTETPEGPTETPEGPTETPEGPTETPEGPTDTGTDEVETTEQTGPGFTAAIALIALVAAALLAVRRDN